ncbi:dATP/dGTP diphosphohydrolase domain-containing protein [Microbulbifer sp. SSSA005]|uniref:dATP/dGTP diphosphohydrolase domain-containing protein n=1 Tax=unclassified Microbulbifer TaxID=2619833 RepID=UPI00403B0951
MTEAMERDPNGKDQHEPGAKCDEGKIMAGVLDDFSLALMAVAEVGTFGANKYTRGGWQQVPNGRQRYRDALWRHHLKERHETKDPETGLLHKAHKAWNALAELELELRAQQGIMGRVAWQK